VRENGLGSWNSKFGFRGIRASFLELKVCFLGECPCFFGCAQKDNGLTFMLRRKTIAFVILSE
jgi:hypothetical protein